MNETGLLRSKSTPATRDRSQTACELARQRRGCQNKTPRRGNRPTKIRTLRLCAHRVHTAGEQRAFLLEGHTKLRGLEETKQRLEQLLQICKEKAVKCECEYVEVTRMATK